MTASRASVPAESYCDLGISLAQRFERLADTGLFPGPEAPGLAEEIAAFVVKYASEYFLGGSLAVLRKFRTCIEGEDESVCDEVLDHLGRDAEDQHQGMAVACLLDVHGTAAFLREVAFAPGRAPPEPGEVAGVDLGAGTGILTAALALAAAREGTPARLLGFERHVSLVRRSNRALASLRPALGPRGIAAVVDKADICADPPYRRVANLRLPLRHWVSETFNRAIPTPIVRGTAVEWPADFSERRRRLAREHGDPFADALDLSVAHFPDFVARIADGRTRAFPDFVHGQLVSSLEQSRLWIGGAARSLSEVGQDFAHLENLFPDGRFPRSLLSESQ